MLFKYTRSFLVLTFLIFSGISPEAFSANIEWKLYIKSHIQSGPILSKSTGEGEEFILRESDCIQIPPESHDIVSALDGTGFLIQHSTVSSIHIILNVDGNMFERFSGISLFINLALEAYVDGKKEYDVTFPQHSPLIMTIPQGSLNSLLGICNLSGDDNLLCVYNSGGNFTKVGITTSNVTSGMTVKMNKLSHIVGGRGEDFGIESNTQIDTWSKIKLLFR